MSTHTRIVYLLWHDYELEGHQSLLLLGVFSEPKLAIAAKRRMRRRPGFKDHPEGLVIAECFVDRDLWPEGFVTVHFSVED
jgi:hypothetical protein